MQQQWAPKEMENMLTLVREVGFRNVGKGFDCGIRNPGKFVLLGSTILIFQFRNTTQGIRDPTNDWNPGSRFH